jgi:hypothetical protein
VGGRPPPAASVLRRVPWRVLVIRRSVPRRRRSIDAQGVSRRRVKLRGRQVSTCNAIFDSG